MAQIKTPTPDYLAAVLLNEPTPCRLCAHRESCFHRDTGRGTKFRIEHKISLVGHRLCTGFTKERTDEPKSQAPLAGFQG